MDDALIEANENGFLINTINGQISMLWVEVFTISVSRIDAITSSIIYLTFDYDFGGYVEINNKMKGFERFLLLLPSYFTFSSFDISNAINKVKIDESIIIFKRS